MAILITDYCCDSANSKQWQVNNNSTDSKDIILICGTSVLVPTVVTIPGSYSGVHCFNSAQRVPGTLTTGPFPVILNEVGTRCQQPDPNVFVEIGDAKWSVKNLNVDRYKNGDTIPQVGIPADWAGLTTGAWCYPNNDPALGLKYGKLYNWYAVNDPRGLAPDGWHVSSKQDWENLIVLYSTHTPVSLPTSLLYDDIADKIKERGTTHWPSPNTASNVSGFTALPAGFRTDYVFTLDTASFATSTDGITNPYSSQILRSVNNSSTNLFTFGQVYSKKSGYSVRIVRDCQRVPIPTANQCCPLGATAVAFDSWYASWAYGYLTLNNYPTGIPMQATVSYEPGAGNTYQWPPCVIPPTAELGTCVGAGYAMPSNAFVIDGERNTSQVFGSRFYLDLNQEVTSIKILVKTLRPYKGYPYKFTITVGDRALDGSCQYDPTLSICGNSCNVQIHDYTVTLGGTSIDAHGSALISIENDIPFANVSILGRERNDSIVYPGSPYQNGWALAFCLFPDNILPGTTTTTIPPAEESLIENYCCYSNTARSYIVHNRHPYNTEVITVRCGTGILAQVRRLLVGPLRSWVFACDSYTIGTSTNLIIRRDPFNVTIPNTGLPIIPIANQIWMKENLKVTNYADGTPIDHLPAYQPNCDYQMYDWVTGIPHCIHCTNFGINGNGITSNYPYYSHRNDPTLGLSTGAYVYTDLGTGKEVISEENRNAYGLLYNYYAVLNPKGLLPKGWRLPTKQDFHRLILASGGTPGAIIGGDIFTYTGSGLKSADYVNHWKSLFGALGHINVSTNTDTVGFTAIGAGVRNGKFYSESFQLYNDVTINTSAGSGVGSVAYESTFKRRAEFWGTGTDANTASILILGGARVHKYDFVRLGFPTYLQDYYQRRADTVCGNTKFVPNNLSKTAYGDSLEIFDNYQNIIRRIRCGYRSLGNCHSHNYGAFFKSIRGVLDCPSVFPWFTTTPGISTTTSTTTKCPIVSLRIKNKTGAPVSFICATDDNPLIEQVIFGEEGFLCNICDIHNVTGAAIYDPHYVYTDRHGQQYLGTNEDSLNGKEALDWGIFYEILEVIPCSADCGCTTTTTTPPAPCCNVVLPLPRLADQDLEIGTNIIHPTYVGPTLPDYPVYIGPNCTYEDMPEGAVTLGRTGGSFTYQLTFSEPTTKVVLLVYGGGGGLKTIEGTNINISAGPSKFTFDTNATKTNIYFCTAYHCYAQTERTSLTEPPTILNIGGPRRAVGFTPGAAFVVVEGLSSNNANAVTPFTQLTISGDGIGGGASFAICNSTFPATTTTTVIPPTPVCKLHTSTLTNNTNFDHDVIYYPTDNTFILSQITVPANATIQLCAYDVIYVPPTITWTPSNVECCNTTSTTTSTTTTTTTAPPPCNTYQATFLGTNGNANFNYTDCNGIVHSPVVGAGIPSLPVSIQFCAIGLPIGNPQISIIQIAGTQCSTTTSTTSTTSTTTTTTIAPPCNTYQAVFTANSGVGNVVYIDCNGVQQTIPLGAPGTLYNQSAQFCAIQVISTGPIIQAVVIASNQCSTSTTSTSTTTSTTSTTTTTTTIAPIGPVGPCGRVDGLNSSTIISAYSSGTWVNFISSLSDACQAYSILTNGSTLIQGLAYQPFYFNSISVGQTAWAQPITAPDPCELILDGYYILSLDINQPPINSIVHVVNGIIVSIDTCGPCNGPFPTEKECYYQLILDGVPQADFSSSITAACDAADIVLHWPEFNDPLALQPVSEIGKTLNWQVGDIVYKTTSTNPPCPDRWTRNGYFVTNWASGEVTEIRSGVIQSIQTCAGFTTTTTTTCAALPTNEIILMNTISYDGGVNFQSFTDSEAHACSSRVNYLNAFAQQNILVNLASVSFLGTSISIGAQLYLHNATNCTQVSNITGYFLTTDTLTNNVIVYVLNGVITAITVCIPTTTTTTCTPQPILGTQWIDYWTQNVRYDIYNNPSAPYVDISGSFESACSARAWYNGIGGATTGTGNHSFLIENGASISIGTQLFETNASNTLCYQPSYFTGYLYHDGTGSSVNYDVVHIVDGIITEFLNCSTCTSPSGLTAFSLKDSYHIGSNPSSNFTETRATACAAINDCIANPGNYTLTGSNMYATSIQVGNRAWDNSGTSCTYYPNGFYIYNFNGSTFEKMIHIVGGIITQIWTDCVSPLAPEPIIEVQKVDECNARTYEYSVNPEDMPQNAVELIWDVVCDTCDQKPGLTTFVDDIYRVQVDYSNQSVDAIVSVKSVDANGVESIFPTTYGVELNSCCSAFPLQRLLITRFCPVGSSNGDENACHRISSEFDICNLINLYTNHNAEIEVYGQNIKINSAIEIGAEMYYVNTCESVTDGWYYSFGNGLDIVETIGIYAENGVITRIVDSCDYIVIDGAGWKKKNLDVTTYRNGDVIPEVQDPTAWAALTTGAWCYYNNSTANGNVYGKLYNHYAIVDPRNIAPEGWRVSTEADWVALEAWNDGPSTLGGKLKEMGTTHWSAPNASAVDIAQFTALPGGLRGITGSFTGLNALATFWTDYTYDTVNAVNRRAMVYTSGAVTTATVSRKYGYSVRLVKEQ
jgi:uncharacterized protein (TIGR02145 family)